MIDERLYSTLFKALPAPTLVLLPNAPVFTIVDVSNSYTVLVGKTREELIGKGFYEVFPHNPYLNNNNWKNIFGTALRTRRPHKMVAQKYASQVTESPDRIDIRYLETQNTPVVDESGSITFIIRTLIDVTESINQNKFLQETQQVARMGSWEVNMAHQTISWSQGLRDIYEVGSNYRPDFNSTLAFYSNKRDREKFIEVFMRAATSGTVFRIVFPITTAKGNRHWLFTVGKAELVDGICARIYGISQDITEKKNTEEALISSEHSFKNLIQTIDGIVWEANAATFEVTFVSEKVTQILGYAAAEWLADPGFWHKHIYEADREQALAYHRQQIAKLANHSFDYRMVRKDGGLIWIRDIVSVVAEAGKPRWLRGIMVDVTKAKRLAEWNRLEKTVLELNAKKDIPIEPVLLTYLTGIETLFPDMYCSIHQVRNHRLFNWAAPSLPLSYLKEIRNLPIDEDAGSCGAAAFAKQLVIVSDISVDPKWADYKHHALKHGLRSCWSYPIVNADQQVTAVLAMYYKEIRTPNEEELMFIDRVGAFLNVILTNRRSIEIAQETALMIQQGQELARFGNWQWDIETNHVTWSDVLYDIYGLDKATFSPSIDDYLALLHPADRQRVSDFINEALKTGEDIVFDERIIRPNKEIRHLRSWGRLVFGPNGAAHKMIGACLDITDTKLAELSLKKLHKELKRQLKIVEESERRYSDLFHLSPLPMWVYELETFRFLDVNNAAINHYAYTREEFLSMTIKDIRPREEIPNLEVAVASLRQHGKLFNEIFIHRKKNGEIIHVQLQVNAITFEGKKAAVVLARDITEKLNYIKAIEAQNRKLQEIAWMQSHVVRAPLARIMGLVDLIRNVPESGIPDKDLMEAINNSSIELDNILRNITNKAEQIDL